MKKLLAIGALALAVPAQAAINVGFTQGGSTLPAGTTVIEDFEDDLLGPIAGASNAFVFNTSPNGIAAQPAFGSTGNYAAVLGVPASGSYSISFAASSIFAFALGSLDTYNTLTLLLSDSTSVSYVGAQINQGILANGDQTNGLTNGIVSYTVDGGPSIVGAVFGSTLQNSFEFDNLAIQAVPEPSTWLMMLMGFAAVGFGMRRRQAAGTLAAA